DEIHQDIFTHFWDPKRKAFAQSKGSTALDASALLMPLIRFVSPSDPRWVSTLRAIERELVSDSLVYRYRLGDGFTDGLTGDEGTFSMCSFWYVECLSRQGDLDQARFYFEKMLGYANHLGLYGEQLGQRGEHLGNFPQAFTHLALISAAFDLDRPFRQRAARRNGPPAPAGKSMVMVLLPPAVVVVTPPGPVTVPSHHVADPVDVTCARCQRHGAGCDHTARRLQHDVVARGDEH